MGSVCRTCSRVNPPVATFCYFDGVALGAYGQAAPVAAGAKPFPTPFVFPSGRACRNFDELARAADEDWAAAGELLRQGFFESFLGGLGRADLALAARQGAKETDRDRGLAQFLGKLPVSARAEPKLAVQPLEINLGVLTGGERRFALHVKNDGAGLLHGTIAGDGTDWLAFGDAPGTPQKLFQGHDGFDMPVHVVHKNLRASNKPVEGRILVESNGGTAVVVVRAEKPVRPFPEGVLAGALLPREIAAKAKANPKEAAALFEKGAVQAWYETNGWTYPVQGPSSSGLGAIQQFFEALGLVQAPKVQISHHNIQFQGRPGGFLEQMLRVQTVEKRPVYAHATTNAPWLQLGRPLLEGRSASIPVRVPSIPAEPGERLRGTIHVSSNGNQRFTVEVELLVAGTAAGRPAPVPVPAVTEAFTAAPAPVVVPAPTVSDIRPSPAPFSDFTTAPLVAAPGRDSDYAAPVARPLLPFILPVVPLLLLGCSAFAVLAHDLLFVAPAVPREAPIVKPRLVDKTPLLALRFHEGPHPDTGGGKDIMPEPTMRFGLLMRRDDKGLVGLTDDDFNALKGRKAADAKRFKRLTFDDWGRSNNTCVKIDGDDFLFGEERTKPLSARRDGKWVTRAEALGEGRQGLRSVWRFEPSGVEVTQTVEIVPGESSYRYDTCLIRYTLENKDSKAHTVGIRFLLDTFIGDNDGVPFTIPGDASLCDTMKAFDTPDKVPDYIQALEKPDLKNPGTIAHLQFRVGSKLESPTRVRLGHWPNSGLAKFPGRPELRDANDQRTLWNVPLVSMQFLHQHGKPNQREKYDKDSAVTLYWDPKPLDAGRTRDVGFTYGLGNVASGEGEGHLLLTVGGRLMRDAEFTLTALVADPKADETLTLTLPPGLKLADGGATQQVPAGAVRGTSTVTWKVRAVQAGDYALTVKSSNGQTQSQPVTIRSAGAFD